MDKFLRFRGAILFSIFIALILSLIPLSAYLEDWRPEWIALTFIYWALFMPEKSSLLLAWFCGLLVDVLFSNSLLGQHALQFVVVVYFTLRLRQRMSPNVIWQQFFLISLVLGTSMLINLWILGAIGKGPNTWLYWTPLLSNLVAWIILQFFLNFLYFTRKAI